jgi:itaconate CoA-transferase
MADAQTRPLEGITVLALEHVIAAPFCTRQLADLGARVIKIERPGVGDPARAYDERVHGMASHFVWVNRSKESLSLDIKQDAAKRIIEQLLGRADVFIQNLAPGAAARMGYSYEALSERFPRLIVCDVSGYGNNGPYRDKKAYDLLVQSEGGLLSITGTPEEPAKAGCSIVDIAAGMYAYSSILAALIQRGKTGRGTGIDVSMLECMAEWMSFPLYYSYDGAEPPPRAGASHATIYPYGPFPAGDGKTLMMGLQNEREWAIFCDRVLERPELKSDERFNNNSRRSAARTELKQIIVDLFKAMTVEQIIARLDAAGIANAHLNDMHDLWAHDQLAARNCWAEIGSEVGPLRMLKPPAVPRDFAPRLAPIPAVGEHTDAILRELGYDAGAVAQMRAAGVV